MGNLGCTIELNRADDQSPGTKLVLEAHHQLCEQRTRSPLRVTINGATVADIEELRTGLQRYDISVPSAIAAESRWHIDLQSADGIVPRDIGLNDDVRTLTIGLVAITIEGES